MDPTRRDRMEVHLKDKDKIRHRKRWSQILYLYYILGFKLMGQYDTVSDVLGGSSADNIFLMALDGDVDFRPDAVHLLLDRMKKNKKVAAVCGRIHPIGDGPMVWGSALMDDNVMRMYTTEPTEAIHFIQYEQGEDRWLCTLLLQQGWKIEYCAGADALTYAPETFHDFYIQRRRWSPSTMANIIDLIGSWRITVKMNDNISVLFMLYQFLLLTSSVVAPGLVVFMIAGSYNTVLKIGLWESYLLSVLPVFLYVLLCLKAKTATQINIAAIMSSVYAIVMLLVTIGTVINVATASILSPDVLFLICLSIIFVIAGIVHPNELFCLGHGILYYLTVPSTFVFLTVFFLCNLHVVTWGTREGPKKVDPAAEQQQQNQAVVVEKGKLYKFFEKLGLHSIVQDVKSFIQQIMGIRQEQQPQNSSQPQGSQLLQQSNAVPAQLVLPPLQKEVVNVPPPVPPKPTQEEVVEPDHTYWTRQLDIPESKVGKIGESEEKFWQWLLEEYLHPIKANKEKQEKITADLISARNNVVFAYMLVNLMFTLVLLQLRLQRDVLIDTFYIAGEYEPASTLALGVFSLLLLTQFAGMLGHRWGTFMHLIASTKLNFFHTNEEEERALAAIQEAQQLTSAGAEGDLGLDPVASDEDEDLGDGMTTVPSTPRPSTVDLQTLGRQDGGDADIEAPDYSDDEEAPDYSDSEGETEFNDSGDRHVQYDDVFDQRYKTVRRHLERGQGQGHTRRAPLYVKQQSAAVSKNRYQREISRRQSLYQSVRHDPRQRRNSFFNV
nr:hypothetical protein BaRGS_004097 [Batillaria attramentaria]